VAEVGGRRVGAALSHHHHTDLGRRLWDGRISAISPSSCLQSLTSLIARHFTAPHPVNTAASLSSSIATKAIRVRLREYFRPRSPEELIALIACGLPNSTVKNTATTAVTYEVRVRLLEFYSSHSSNKLFVSSPPIATVEKSNSPAIADSR
jgi:hypothetical protein